MSIKDLKKSARATRAHGRDVHMSSGEQIDIVLHGFSPEEKDSFAPPPGTSFVNMPSKLVRSHNNKTIVVCSDRKSQESVSNSHITVNKFWLTDF